MRIESGTTGERRTRILIFLLMCLAFAGWFGYDGIWGYPAKNREWARQALPEKPADLRTNRRVRTDTLNRLTEGMPLEELTALLGEPALIDKDNHWFVGPAAYARIEITNGQVAKIEVHEQREPSESHIRNQKILAGLLLIISLITAVKFIKVVTMRVVLDDAGLTLAGKHLAWDAMTGLNGEKYATKGWVDLTHDTPGANRSMRLDSYHIDKFDEIIQAICERKGFSPPVMPADTDADDNAD